MRHPKGIAGLHFPKLRLRTCVGIRQKLKEGYAFSDLKSDLMAGIVVSMVAIPLGMALAIASGVAPQFGLYTVIVAGFITALLGGSRFNVTGPTAAFVVVLVPIAQNFGLAGLLLAGAMAGVMLVILGITGLGQAIKLIPHPVTTGFTAGISVVIATIQLKDFFGLTYEGSPQHYIDRIGMVIKNASTASLSETSIALCTLAILILWPKINKKIPSPLVALSIVTIATIALQNIFPEFQIATINNRFLTTIDGIVVYGIPQALPQFAFPWTFPGAVGKSFTFDFQTIQTLIPSAIAIAMLGAIESLLCAVVADGMTQTKHDPNAELTALGVANMICPFFGGIAATGAIARTATNIRFGARSPLAAIIHSIITMLIVLLFANYVSYLPMAALSALLMLVAYNMSEIKNFGHIVKAAPRSDVVVLLTCFSLTVLFDMVIGVTFGVLMAALLFIRRMTNLTIGRIQEGPYHKYKEKLPQEIVLYEIAGPLFFGAAEKAITHLQSITNNIKVVIFDLEDVPIMDITGVIAFETAVNRLSARNKVVFIAGLKRQPEALLKKSKIILDCDHIQKFPNVSLAVDAAMERLLIKTKSHVGGKP